MGAAEAIVSFDAVSAAARRTQEQVRQEMSRSASLQANGARLAAELERQRSALTLRGIANETERRKAAIELEFQLQQQAITKIVSARLKAGEISRKQAAQTRKEFDDLIAAARTSDLGRVSEGVGGIAKSGNNASEAMIQLARGIEDAGHAGANLGNIVRFSSNNLSQFASQLVYVRREAAAAGSTVTRQLVASLAGPAGFIFALSVITTALPVLLEKLRKTDEGFRDSADAAKEARDAYLAAARAAGQASLSFEVGGETFVIRSLEEAEGVLERIGGLIQTRQRDLRRLTQQRDNMKPSEDPAGFLRIARNISVAEAEIEAFQAQIEKAREAATRFRTAPEAEAALAGLGLATQDQIRESEAAANAARSRQAAEARRAQRRLETEQRQAAGQRADLLAQLDIERLEDQRERELAAVRAERAGRLRIVAGNAEAETLVRTIASRKAVEINLRYTKDAYQAEAQVRRSAFELAQRRAEVRGALDREAFEARVAYLDAELARARDAFGEEAQEVRALTDERERALLDFEAFENEVRDRRRRKELGLLERVARAREENAERAARDYERELASVERQTSRVLDVFAEAALFRRDLSDAEVEYALARYDAEERALLDSLERRESSQAEYDREVRALAAERSEFEKAAEADRASFVARSILGLRDLAIEAGAEELQRYVARKAAEVLFTEGAEGTKTAVTLAGAAERIGALAAEGAAALVSGAKTMVSAVASLIESVVSVVPFPFSLAAIPAAGAALYAGYAGAKALFLASGGAVRGPGGPTEDRVPAMLSNGEHVLTARDVERLGGQDGVYRFRSLLAQGALPRFAAGGAVVRPRPVPTAARPAPDRAAVDLAPLAAEVRALRADSARMVEEVRRLAGPVVVSATEARRLNRDAARETRILRGGRR